MATLTISTSANGHDRARHRDLDNPVPRAVGAVGNSGSNTAFGQGMRHLNTTLSGTDTVSAAYWDLLKSGTASGSQDVRLVFTDEDNRGANWSASSPNRPGDPAIQSGSIAAENTNTSHTDAVRYQWPPTGSNQTTFGAGAESTLGRGGWASGNALASVCNSDQDASAIETFARKDWHDNDSATASSEPAVVITYTAAAAGGITHVLSGVAFRLAGRQGLA